MKPIISVLVPSRNREKYLLSLISIIENCLDQRIEFLISDNSDLAINLSTNSPNIHFFRPERVLNMTDHWNFLLGKANGKYLSFLGDDDAFIPSSLIELCNILDKIEPDLVWTRTAGYGWPQNGSDANFTQIIRKDQERNSLQKARIKVQSLKYSDLPIPYNYALVKRQVILDFLRTNPDEKFFSSRVPDINSGVKILFLSKTQYDFQRLTFISGASPLSNGLLTRTDPTHPSSTEFNNPTFNPVKKRPNAIVTSVNPFGFMTYFEAIEESMLQLGEKIKCRQWVLAFRSVFSSSFPAQQLLISLQIWPEYKFILKFSYLVRELLSAGFIPNFSRKLREISLVIKAVLRKIDIVIIRGPGINDTFSLVSYLETNSPSYGQKWLERIYVEK